MSIAHWIGRQIASIHDFFRSLTPCSVDWEYREEFVNTLDRNREIGTVTVNGVEYPVTLADYCCGIDGECICDDSLATDTIGEWKLNRLPNE